MYAEAQKAAGPDASVYAQVNDVRARPGVNMPPLAAGLTKDQMRDRIRPPTIKTKYEDKYEYWLIPQTEIDRNQPVQTRNPDY